jgi:hypothetical protein
MVKQNLLAEISGGFVALKHERNGQITLERPFFGEKPELRPTSAECDSTKPLALRNPSLRS